jgi:Protein of unknown function (DUF2628)
MKLYSVYARPEDAAFEEAVFVAQEFSWPAFVFGGLWALANRMWIVAAVMLAGLALLSSLPEREGLFVSLGVAVLAGMFAPELKAWSLRRRGFAKVGQASGGDMEAAEIVFYANPPVAPPSAPRAVPTAPGADPLGLFEQA